MSEHRSRVAVGINMFAAAAMMILGFFEALQGFAALVKQNYFVVTKDYVYKFDVRAWGWIHLILGIVILVAGVALIYAQLWARIVGIVLASVIAIANFMWLPYQPVWSGVIIGTSLLVTWALAYHGRDIVSG